MAAERGADGQRSGYGWAQPLRFHLSFIIVILLLGVSLPLMWLNYRQGKDAAVQAAEQQMLLLSRHAIDRYRSIFDDGLAATSITSVSDAFVAEPPADLNAKMDLLLRALAGSSTVDGLYVGYPTGAFIHAVNLRADPAWGPVIGAPDGTVAAIRIIRSGESGLAEWQFFDEDGRKLGRNTVDSSYDPRTRPWYRTAALDPDPIWVGPYLMATTRKLGLTVARAMKGHGEIVVGADVLLETVSRLLSDEAVSPNGRGYVLDDAGRLIVHSDPEMMKRVLAALDADKGGEVDDPVLAAARSLLPDEPDSAERSLASPSTTSDIWPRSPSPAMPDRCGATPLSSRRRSRISPARASSTFERRS